MNNDITIAVTEETNESLYQEYRVKVDAGQSPLRIDKWLQMRIEGSTRNKIQTAVENKLVTVNGEVVKSNYKIHPGDTILFLRIFASEYTALQPENIPLTIVFEDEDILVINKPPNMVVHPGIGNHSGTLLNGVLYHLLQQNPELSEETLPRYGLVHRIDKNTTGLLVVAKTEYAAAHLAKQFFNHTVQRKYVALVWGDIKKDNGTIVAHIDRHERNRKMFAAYPDGERGKHAITHYNVLQRMNYVTLVECVLETGRTHQIRVHMKHVGHTLFNDWEYGGDKILKGTVYTKYKQFVENCFITCPRCALHAKTLGFTHPRTGETVFFESPLPKDIQQLIEKWSAYTSYRADSFND